MPYSSNEHAQTIQGWFAEHARAHAQGSIRVLDVGAGAGWNVDRYRASLPHSHWTALEVFEPYVERFDLRDRYDEVWVQDVREFTLVEAVLAERPNVILLGDVLEHLEQEDAVNVWLWAQQLVTATGLVIATLPIVHWPQGEEEGNPHEAHLHHYSPEEFRESFSGIEREALGTVTGAFLARGTACDE